MDSLHRIEVYILIFPLLVHLSCSYPGPSAGEDARGNINRQREKLCLEVPPSHLRQVLGSAYNEYYMAFDAPQPSTSRQNYKRSPANDNGTYANHQFFVKDDLKLVLSEKPAWKVDFTENEANLDWKNNIPVAPKNKRDNLNFPEAPSRHVKRSISNTVLDAIGLSGDTQFKWHCEAPLQWQDLGKDYFPRYILSVDCHHSGCRGNGFKCTPRSFAIKVLRRRDGVCAPGFSAHRDTLQIGSEQMPDSLRELWVWEMRAVSFCCVCQYQSHSSSQPSPYGG